MTRPSNRNHRPGRPGRPSHSRCCQWTNRLGRTNYYSVCEKLKERTLIHLSTRPSDPRIDTRALLISQVLGPIDQYISPIGEVKSSEDSVLSEREGGQGEADEFDTSRIVAIGQCANDFGNGEILEFEVAFAAKA